MLLPGNPVSFPLRASAGSLSPSAHKGVSRSAAAVGLHGSSRGRTSVRKQGDPDRLQAVDVDFGESQGCGSSRRGWAAAEA